MITIRGISSVNLMATALPIPLDPPVITTTLDGSPISLLIAHSPGLIKAAGQHSAFLGFNECLSPIGAALEAHVMGKHGLVALRTSGRVSHLSVIMGSSHVPS
jgi:hypothetical protein